MGANAVTSVPTYVAGQVLDASRLNVTNSGVPVFADTIARDAGFGGSGEKVLAEGQLAYLEDSNVVQYYDGAAWATVGPIPGGLALVKTQTIGTAVASVTVTGAFSSTYDNYFITVNGGVGSTVQGMTFQLGSTTTGYYRGNTGIIYSSGAVNANNQNNAASYTCGLSTANQNNLSLFVFDPNTAKRTTFAEFGLDARTNGASGFSAGFEDSTTQHTAFTLAVGGTMTGGEIRVYGYANS
jgi:hypothetical protein